MGKGESVEGNRRMIYGPDNPHPLSTRRTELIWEGKYDEYGNRREVTVAGYALPMRRIETIDEPRSEAAAAGQLGLFEKKTKRLDDFPNRLIWGDNKLVMMDRRLAEEQLRLWITGVSRLGSWG